METQKKKYRVSTGGPSIMVRPFLAAMKRYQPKGILGVLEDGEDVTVLGEEQCKMDGLINWLRIEFEDDGVKREGYIAKMYAKPLEG